MSLMRTILIFSFFLFCNFLIAQNDSLKNVGTIQLLEFTATIKSEKVVLTWLISTEKNNKEFIVYRSIDAVNWYVVANVSGRQNGLLIKKYESIDITASGGVNHYKLTCIDLNGKQTTLKIIKIDMEDKSKQIKATIDQLASKIKLESAEQIFNMDLELTDILGRSYYVPYVRDDTHAITVVTGPLDAGVYYLKCYLNKSRTVMKKIMMN